MQVTPSASLIMWPIPSKYGHFHNLLPPKKQQAYNAPPHVPVWYGGPQSAQPQPQHSQAAYYQGTPRPGAHYLPVSSETIQRRFNS